MTFKTKFAFIGIFLASTSISIAHADYRIQFSNNNNIKIPEKTEQLPSRLPYVVLVIYRALFYK